MSELLRKNLEESLSVFQSLFGEVCQIDCLVVLGSGFREFTKNIEISKEAPFSEIPHFCSPKVAGHGSSVVVSNVDGQRIMVYTGRTHMYEGYSADQVSFPVRTAIKYGIKNILLTNAAGGLQKKLSPGDILVLEDQINLTGENCLRGNGSLLGPQFVDMINCFDREWRKGILAKANVKPGSYIGLMGPTYETPAETKFYGQSGADVVGMSTVQEVIAARQMGASVAGLSFVTNLAGGLSSEVNHQDVIEIGKKKAPELLQALKVAIQARPKD